MILVEKKCNNFKFVFFPESTHRDIHKYIIKSMLFQSNISIKSFTLQLTNYDSLPYIYPIK